METSVAGLHIMHILLHNTHALTRIVGMWDSPRRAPAGFYATLSSSRAPLSLARYARCGRCGRRSNIVVRPTVTPLAIRSVVDASGRRRPRSAVSEPSAAAAEDLLLLLSWRLVAAAKVDLTAFDTTAEVTAAFDLWQRLHGRLDRREMPPRGVPQPTDAERRTITDWLSAVQEREADRLAGDPGVVLARRLSHAEYNYTIQDLTGVDIAPTRTFPVDPANEAGFDNSGETLAISPALLAKYIDAARNVADHIVLQPRGFSFAPHEVVTDPDRDRFVVNRIMDFYRRQRTDLADYFFALWRYDNRSALGLKGASLASVAADQGLSVSYLERLRRLLQDRTGAFGPIAGMQQRWDALPAAPHVRMKRPCAPLPQRSATTSSATGRSWAGSSRCQGPGRCTSHRRSPRCTSTGRRPRIGGCSTAGAHRRGCGRIRQRRDMTPTSSCRRMPRPRAAAVASLEKFCDIIPDAFLVTERTSPWLAKDQTGRLLSAGFHSAMGYFRDDGPLYDLLLNDAGRRELDELWRELDFISNAPARQLAGFVWFERTDTELHALAGVQSPPRRGPGPCGRREVRRAAAAV